jgi:hypothetical protein
MHVQFQPAAEALHGGHRAALTLRDAGAPGTPGVPAEHRADEHAQHGTAERVVERQAVAQAVRHGEHPLAHGDEGQHGLDEVRRLLGHAAAATARADGPGFTGEWHEPLEPARVAAHAGKTPAEHATPEELPELALDEARHPGAVGRGGRLREKAFEVRAHDVVEDRPRRRPWLVDPRRHAGAQPRPCRRSGGQGGSVTRRIHCARGPRVQRPVKQVASGWSRPTRRITRHASRGRSGREPPVVRFEGSRRGMTIGGHAAVEPGRSLVFGSSERVRARDHAGGLVQVLHRVAACSAPTYHALVAAVRRSRVVAPDATGWKVGGRAGGGDPPNLPHPPSYLCDGSFSTGAPSQGDSG